MMRISRMLYTACIAILPFTLIPATTAHAQTATVPEMTTTGLLTFSEHDRAMRVAIVLAEADGVVVDTIVRFVDARGNVLKARRGNLRDDAPFIIDLTRSDVGGLAEVLVRAQVFHNLPGIGSTELPILITLQSLSDDGTSHHVVGWHGGFCGPWHIHTNGKSLGGGVWADCTTTFPDSSIPSSRP